MEWTPEIIDKMFELADKGYSLALIARELGCTKNCVVGKYARERRNRGIPIPQSPRRPAVVIKQRNHRPSKPRKAAFVLKVVPSVVITPKTPPRPRRKSTVGILDVTGCKWAVGEDDAVIGRHTFCNAATDNGHSYCEEHRRENVASYSRDLISKTIKSAIKADKPRAA